LKLKQAQLNPNPRRETKTKGSHGGKFKIQGEKYEVVKISIKVRYPGSYGYCGVYCVFSGIFRGDTLASLGRGSMWVF